MIVNLLTEHHLEFLSFRGGCRVGPSLHLSKCQIVENLMPQLKISCIGPYAYLGINCSPGDIQQ